MRGWFALPAPVATLLERGEEKGRWLGDRVESGSLSVDEALWQIYKWCKKNMSGVGAHEAACHG